MSKSKVQIVCLGLLLGSFATIARSENLVQRLLCANLFARGIKSNFLLAALENQIDQYGSLQSLRENTEAVRRIFIGLKDYQYRVNKTGPASLKNTFVGPAPLEEWSTSDKARVAARIASMEKPKGEGLIPPTFEMGLTLTGKSSILEFLGSLETTWAKTDQERPVILPQALWTSVMLTLFLHKANGLGQALSTVMDHPLEALWSTYVTGIFAQATIPYSLNHDWTIENKLRTLSRALSDKRDATPFHFYWGTSAHVINAEFNRRAYPNNRTSTTELEEAPEPTKITMGYPKNSRFAGLINSDQTAIYYDLKNAFYKKIFGPPRREYVAKTQTVTFDLSIKTSPDNDPDKMTLVAMVRAFPEKPKWKKKNREKNVLHSRVFWAFSNRTGDSVVF